MRLEARSVYDARARRLLCDKPQMCTYYVRQSYCYLHLFWRVHSSFCVNRFSRTSTKMSTHWNINLFHAKSSLGGFMRLGWGVILTHLKQHRVYKESANHQYFCWMLLYSTEVKAPTSLGRVLMVAKLQVLAHLNINTSRAVEICGIRMIRKQTVYFSVPVTSRTANTRYILSSLGNTFHESSPSRHLA